MAEDGYMEDEKEICFVVTPIGSEGSETRLRADKVLRHIIEPVVEEFEYEPVRADQISNPGIITHQVIQHLLHAPLVVADLTEGNPNVFYELGIRHMTRKPVVSIVEVGERIPFDVSQSRAVQVNHRDLDSVASCKDELKRQIQSLQANPRDFFNPVSVTVDVEALSQSGDPDSRSIAAIFSLLEGMNAEISRLRSEVAGATNPRRLLPSDRFAGLERMQDVPGVLYEDLNSGSSLSPVDFDILKGLALGKSNRQIAEDLRMPEKFLRSNLQRIYSILGVKDRFAAVEKFVEQYPEHFPDSDDKEQPNKLR